MTARGQKVSAIWGAVVLATFLALATTASAVTSSRGITPHSTWADSGHGWAVHYPPQGRAQLHATDDGGRSWRLVFVGGNYIFYALRTSSSAGIVETGGWAGATFWTRDGGRHWYFTRLFPGADYRFERRSLVQAGRGSSLFWHLGGDTLYRVEGWPPRGDVPCEPDPILNPQPPGRTVCAVPPGEAGMHSVVAARLHRGAFGAMRSTAAGVVALVDERNGRHQTVSASHVAVYRAPDNSLSLAPFPDTPPLKAGEELAYFSLAAAWPRLFVTAPVWMRSSGRRGTVVWRSEDGGGTWRVTLTRSLPKRVALIDGSVRIGARWWIPGGFVASARVGRRRALLIRQLGSTRTIALPGATTCTTLEAASNWPELFVEGRRGGTRALWWSPDGGKRWTRLGRC
jgi:hypothetical protein